MQNRFFAALLCALLFALAACDKTAVTPEADPTQQATLVLKFDNLVGTEILQRGIEYTNTLSGESFKVTDLRYFISNIKLQKADGSEYVIPQDDSYFLVDDAVAASKNLSLQVPEGDYTGVSFMIGVDSLRSTMPVERRRGALDVAGQAQGMYWSWNAGYIFFFLEGESDLVIDNGRFRYHIGLFGGFSTPTLNNTRMATLSFERDKAIARKDRSPEVHIMLDLLKVFNGQAFPISIAEYPEIMARPESAGVANNIQEAFFYDHIHN